MYQVETKIIQPGLNEEIDWTRNTEIWDRIQCKIVSINFWELVRLQKCF